MHVYLGSKFKFTEEEFITIRDMRIVTGMGFGSHIIRFQFDPDTIKNNENKNEAVEQDTPEIGNDTVAPAKVYSILNDTAKEFLIYAHLTDPPANLSPNNEIIVEPTSFFSVLWPNLFRTMYAGILPIINSLRRRSVVYPDAL